MRVFVLLMAFILPQALFAQSNRTVPGNETDTNGLK